MSIEISRIEVDSFCLVENNIWTVFFRYDDEIYCQQGESASFSIDWSSKGGVGVIDDEVMNFINEVKKDIECGDDIDSFMREVSKRSNERSFQMRAFGTYEPRKGDEPISIPYVKMSGADRFGSYDDHVLSESQMRQLRWHDFDIELKDERFKDGVICSNGLITKLGDTGEKLVYGFIKDVISAFGQFDGFVNEHFNTVDYSKNLSEKNLMMFNELNDRIHKHILNMLGVE